MPDTSKTTRSKTLAPKEPDILERLVDLHKQATIDRSHNYVGLIVLDAAAEIRILRTALSQVHATSQVVLRIIQND